MTLQLIAIRNLVRRKGKAAFVLAGLVIGVATVIAVISFTEAMSRDVTHKLEKYGANILIVPRSESLALSYGGLSLGGVAFEMEEIEEKSLERVNTIKNAANIAAQGPMVLGVVKVAGQRVLYAGVDFEAARILRPWWRINGSLPGDSGLLLGAEAARLLGLGPGASVEINGRRVEVEGVLAPTGSQDDQLIFSRLPTAQALLNKVGKVSMVEVAALCTACPIDDMVRQIKAVLPGAKVMAIQQVVKSRMAALDHFRKFSYGVSAVVLLIGGLVVMVTMMGSVRERTEEIGIFRAIGFRKSHVIRIVFIEAGIISTVAGAAGYLAGVGATELAIRIFTDSATATVAIKPELAAMAVAIAVLVGIMSSIYPAILASRLDPNEALRAL
jgi:putative ABC transport system permease protein